MKDGKRLKSQSCLLKIPFISVIFLRNYQNRMFHPPATLFSGMFFGGGGGGWGEKGEQPLASYSMRIPKILSVN